MLKRNKKIFHYDCKYGVRDCNISCYKAVPRFHENNKPTIILFYKHAVISTKLLWVLKGNYFFLVIIHFYYVYIYRL